MRIGCGLLGGGVLALLMAPRLQRDLGRLFHFSTTEFGPAMVLILLGAAIGGALGWYAERHRKW
jgi:hypothetical protein